MSAMQELAAQALIGTERRAPTLPVAEGPIGELLAQIAHAEGDMETRVLRSAGVLAVCGDAGFMPPPAQAPARAVCEMETTEEATEEATEGPEQKTVQETQRMPADRNFVSLLQQVLKDGPDSLRLEALRGLAATRSALPARLLPMALQLARQTSSLRADLLPVLGARGRWLAGLNADWDFVATGNLSLIDQGSSDSWEHGNTEQRQRYLGLLRASDPARARTLFVEALPELDARERAALLQQLATALGAEDEALLESLLQDRSKEVRQVAADLLSRLPASRYVERMSARMADCLRTERKLLRRVLTIEAPETFPADWKQDALEEPRAKSEPLGERAWWLYQIARGLPLAWWSTQTDMQPAELFGWASASDWGPSLLRAWREAMIREAGHAATAGVTASWAAAQLEHKSVQPQDVFDLIDYLPLRQREAHWLRILEHAARSVGTGDLFARIVRSVNDKRIDMDPAATLSADFCRQALQRARTHFAQNNSLYDYTLRKSLVDFVCLIPAGAFDEAATPWPLDPQSQFFNETAARVLLVIEQRKALHQYLHQHIDPRKPS